MKVCPNHDKCRNILPQGFMHVKEQSSLYLQPYTVLVAYMGCHSSYSIVRIYGSPSHIQHKSLRYLYIWTNLPSQHHHRYCQSNKCIYSCRFVDHPSRFVDPPDKQSTHSASQVVFSRTNVDPPCIFNKQTKS